VNKRYLIVFCLLAFKAQAQTLTPDSLLKILPDSFPQERVYLHLDKDKYMGGDSIWFKAYVTSGILPGETSTGIHLELFNPAGSRVQQKYFPVILGRVALGELELKDSLPTGMYTIRAYTDWMGNFDPAFFYHYTFPVYATTGPKAAPAPPVQKDVDIQFLPEGGDAVKNVFTNVAFRAIDEQGLPVTIRGRVVDDQDTLAAEFTTQHDGMGQFVYTPWEGRTYTAIVQTPLGERKIPLPAAKADGVVLNAKVTSRGVGFILRADTLSHFLDQPLEIVASMFGSMVFRARTRLTRDMPESSGFIPTNKAVTGVMTLTIFTHDGVPLAERAVFIRPIDVRIPATLSLDTLNTDSKGLNSWNVHLPDTTRGYFSVSVTDADALTPGADMPTILSGLLLTGDIRGHVYHPAWYFRDDSDSTQAALDLVMLTQGWRRYDWAALEQGKFPEIHWKGNSYLNFNGEARTESGKKIVGNTMLTVFLRSYGADSLKKLIILPLDSSGQFTLDDLVFFDTATAYFQVSKKGYAGKNVQLRLQPRPSFPLDPLAHKGAVFPPIQEDTAFIGTGNKEADLLAGIRRLQRAKELKEIIIRGHKKNPVDELDERYTSGLFSGGFGHSFDLVNDNKQAISYFDIVTFLQGRVPGLLISGSYPNLSVRYRGGTPDFFVDEINTTMDMVETVPVADIAYVKVFEPPFVGSFGGGPHGAIAIYTKRGGDVAADEPGLNRLSLTGYYVIRSFYAPVYNRKDTAGMNRPDYRITLNWEPYLFSSPKVRTLPVRFYNNDACKHYRIIVEGMDENGKLLHLEQVVGSKNQ